MVGVVQTARQLVSLGVGGYFDVAYAEWAKNVEATRGLYRRLAASAAFKVKAGKVLEIGPGPGYLSVELARLLPGVRVVGLELSDTMIGFAEKNADEHGASARVEFRRGDAAEIPFKGASFDFVISSWSLHLWKRPAQILSEIYRVLKPGCSALVYDARRDAPKEEVKKWMRSTDSLIMRKGLRHSFGAAYTPQEIEDIVRDAPFRNCKVQIEGANMSIWLAK